jgi:hypothetical protein
MHCIPHKTWWHLKYQNEYPPSNLVGRGKINLPTNCFSVFRTYGDSDEYRTNYSELWNTVNWNVLRACLSEKLHKIKTMSINTTRIWCDCSAVMLLMPTHNVDNGIVAMHIRWLGNGFSRAWWKFSQENHPMEEHLMSFLTTYKY